MSAIATGPAINGWRSTPLKAEVTLKNGKAYNAKDWKKEGYPIIRIQNLRNPLAEFNYFQGDPETEVPIRSGDLVFSWSGSKGTSFGPHIWQGELGVLNQHIFKVEMNPGSQLGQDFLYYALRFLTAVIEDKAYGLAALVHVRKGDLESTPIPFPPLPEQKTIAHILSTVQRAIEAQERIIQTTTELKKALMHKLFTEGLRNEPQKQTEIGPVPESWATPTVESVCTIRASAMSYSHLEKAPTVSDGVRVIGIKVSDMNLPGNEIEFRSANLERLLTEKEARKRTVPADSIIFPKRGAAIATNKKRLTTGYTVLDPNLIAVMPSEAVNHRYLFHWFNTFDLKKITDPGPTPQLNKKDIAPLKFPMPPVADQEAIATAIDAAAEKATLHCRKRDQLEDLFRTLLYELMTAKTRVHNVAIK